MLTSLEKLIHFQCDHCEKWWSIGDAPIEEKKEWFCPWCGEKNHISPDRVTLLIYKSKEAYGKIEKHCGSDWEIVSETESTVTMKCCKEAAALLCKENIYAVNVDQENVNRI